MFTTPAPQVSNAVVEQYNSVHLTHALLENEALYDVCRLTSTSSVRPTRTQPPRQFARRSQLAASLCVNGALSADIANWLVLSPRASQRAGVLVVCAWT